MISVKINVDEGVIMQKIQFLLLGTSLSFIPQSLSAQCVSPIQDCSTLGYTQTSCPNGKGVKCPFGSGWYCGGTAAQDCIKLGYDKDCTGAGESGSGETCNGKYQSCTCDSSYKYTCSGTGYSGGSGSACGGKYTSCTCASGYEWKNGACTELIQAVSCTVGTLYYSDGKCYNKNVTSKTLLGVVIMEKTTSANGWIMTVNPVETSITWALGDDNVYDIPSLSNISSEDNLTDIQSSCTNTDIITAYGDSSKFPAAWAAKNYRPSGTPSEQRWCLPSGGLLKNSIFNTSNLSKVNAGITIAGGTNLGNVDMGEEAIWSSSEHSAYYAWDLHIATGRNKLYIENYIKIPSASIHLYSVRPVLAF